MAIRLGSYHTCGGPVFGRLAPKGTCPRCDELRRGAQPRQGWGRRRRDDTQWIREIRQHDCRAWGCGPVCTFGDW